MKKKILVCLVLALVIVLFASTGFAYGTAFLKAFSEGPYTLSTSMHIQDACTKCYVVSSGANTYHKSFIINSAFDPVSATLNLYGGQTKNIYPNVGGSNLYLRIQNNDTYYGKSVYTSGTVTVHYNP